jgi:HD-GYP domain-containing protein (c-di-GMP phosphodiesterase class II)
MLRKQFAKSHCQAAEQMDFIQQALLHQDKVDGDLLSAITESALRELAADPDLFVSVPVTADTTTYPAKHSLYSAMIALAMGVRLGMDRRMLRELAIGCLVHDSGDLTPILVPT